MEQLDLILAKSNVTAIIHSLRISIDEVKEKRPNATDYIDGMNKHMKSMLDVYSAIEQMEMEISTMRSVMYNYHRENMEMRLEIKNLKEQNTNLYNGL
jgi:hypothetical protein